MGSRHRAWLLFHSTGSFGKRMFSKAFPLEAQDLQLLLLPSIISRTRSLLPKWLPHPFSALHCLKLTEISSLTYLDLKSR